MMVLNCGVEEDSGDSKEIKPVNNKGNQSRIFIGLWPPDVNNWLIEKYPEAGKV